MIGTLRGYSMISTTFLYNYDMKSFVDEGDFQIKEPTLYDSKWRFYLHDRNFYSTV